MICEGLLPLISTYGTSPSLDNSPADPHDIPQEFTIASRLTAYQSSSR